MATLKDLLAQLSDGHDGLAAEAENRPPAAGTAAPSADTADQPSSQAPYRGVDPPQAVQDALREMIRGYELESDAVRRHKVKQWREGEEFWRGNQNIWYSSQDSRWHTPFERGAASQD